jgi:hypothetical protein
VDVLRGKFGYFVERRGIPKDTPRGLVIEHLECLSAHDLEPVHDAFDAGIGIEMSVRDHFLLEWDIIGCPAKEYITRNIDHSDKNRGIYY